MKGQYRSGRIGCFIYKQSNENPIDLDDLKVTGNPELNEAILNQQVDRLWVQADTDKELLLKYGLVALGIIAIAIVIIILASKGNPLPNPIKPVV